MTHDLTDPWLLAVWPGMGNVALSAGAYLLEQLGAEPLAELDPEDHFELETVRVRDGIVVPGGLPKTRLYGWKNPNGRDLLILTGEAQPTRRALDYCRKILHLADTYGVKRIVTFASLVTPTPPDDQAQVFGVATGPSLLRELNEASGEPLPVIKSGAISGLNGTLLSTAAARGQEGFCLLGQVPRIAAQVPYLRAALAVLELFRKVAEVEIDLDELRVQADAIDQGLVGLLERLKQMARDNEAPEWMALDDSFELELEPAALPHDPEREDEPTPESTINPSTLARLEELFLNAEGDREQALLLKEELDRLSLFDEYEDRFLDLFRS